VLDGFEIGIGIMFPFAKNRRRERRSDEWENPGEKFGKENGPGSSGLEAAGLVDMPAKTMGW